MAGLDDLATLPAPAKAIAPAPVAPPDKPAEPSKPGVVEKMISGFGSGVKDAVEKNKALDATTMKMSPPELKQPPKPEFKNTDPMEAWGSIAMVFAALASTKVRTHASTAMNAAAATMKAFQEKDKEAYDRGFKEWEAASKNALDLANFQQRSYNDLLQHYDNKERMNLDAGKALDAAEEAKLKTLTTALQDPGMWAAYEKNGIAGAVDFQNTRAKHEEDFKLKMASLKGPAEKAAEALSANIVRESPEFKEAMSKGDSVEGFRLLATAAPLTFGKMYEDALKHKNDLEFKQKKSEESAAGQAKMQFDSWLDTPEGQAASVDQRNAKEAELYRAMTARGAGGHPPLSDENKHFHATEIAAYREKAPAPSSFAFGRDPNGWTDVLTEAEKINPGFNESKYDLVKEARKKITIGKDADAIASYVRLNQHLQFFSDLVEKLSNGSDLKVLDKIAASWGRQTGNQYVTSYETALQLVGDEMVKAATGTGAAGALADREEIKKNFDPSLSKEQLRANIDSVRTLVGGAVVSTLNKYRSALSPEELRDITGLSPEDLESYHVDPKVLQSTRKGPVMLGGRTVPDPTAAAPEGAPADASAAPSTGAYKWEYVGDGPKGEVGYNPEIQKYVYKDGSLVEGQ